MPRTASSRFDVAPLIHFRFISAFAALVCLLPGCARPERHEAQARPAPPPPANSPPVAAVSEAPEDVRELLILSQKKRIMGRKASLPSVRRIATETGNHVARALEQPSIQDDLRALAETAGMSVKEYKAYWKSKQEADLLLESGGDPNARSVSDAIGVAQWLAGTGRASGGLRIDAGASRRLTGKIYQLQARVDAFLERPETWIGEAPPGEPAPALAKTAPALDPAAPVTSTAASVPTEAAPPRDDALVTTPTAAPPAAAPGSSTGAPAAATEPTNPTPAVPPGSSEETPASGAAGPPAARPVAPSTAQPAPSTQPARPTWTRDQWIAYLGKQIREIEAKRKGVDERYDPARAIAAQTRYLVRLARRYGSLDWAFQAYHGGEGGVQNTVSYYLGPRYRAFASAEAAIRGVLPDRGSYRRVRSPLNFEDLYFGTTPLSHPAAFSYLYGRSDYHRYYWWKIEMAERAIALYRKDPKEFRRQWEALRPGQRLEVAWYPKVKDLSFHTVADLKQAYADGTLVRLPADLKRYSLVTGNVAPLDPENAYQYKGLRPAAMGALLRLAEIYRENGGASAPLRIQGLAQTTGMMSLLAERNPPPWVRNPPDDPADIPVDLHATGLCFDLERPQAAWNRKVLEYALGVLADRQRIYWIDETVYGPRRYHICPSPGYTRELTRTYQASLPTSGKKG